METAIVAIIFLLLCINPPMALRYWLMYDFCDKRNQTWAKGLQTLNAVATIALVVLVFILFDKLGYSDYVIRW